MNPFYGRGIEVFGRKVLGAHDRVRASTARDGSLFD